MSSAVLPLRPPSCFQNSPRLPKLPYRKSPTRQTGNRGATRQTEQESHMIENKHACCSQMRLRACLDLQNEIFRKDRMKFNIYLAKDVSTIGRYFAERLPTLKGCRIFLVGATNFGQRYIKIQNTHEPLFSAANQKRL